MYEDPIQIRPYLPPDRGYYFEMRNCDIKIIRYTLEDNGFREMPQKEKMPSAVMGTASLFPGNGGMSGASNAPAGLKAAPTIIWYVSSVKNAVYQQL